MKRKRIVPKAHSPEEQEHVDLAYLTILLWQCDSFVNAMVRLNTSLSKADFFRRSTDYDEVFADVQSVITFAANVGKMLWPDPKPRMADIAKARAGRLQQLVGIRNDKALEDRRIRDDFEHIDERIDLWTQRQPANLVIHFVTDDDAMAVGNPTDYFTRLNRKTLVASMLLHRVNLQELSDSVIKVRAAAIRVIQDIEARRQQPAPQP
jgi:hypothetical protein